MLAVYANDTQLASGIRKVVEDPEFRWTHDSAVFARLSARADVLLIATELLDSPGVLELVVGTRQQYPEKPLLLITSADRDNAAHRCNLHGNAGVAVRNLAAGLLDARENWWGDSQGPHVPAGDGVAGNVEIQPFSPLPLVTGAPAATGRRPD